MSDQPDQISSVCKEVDKYKEILQKLLQGLCFKVIFIKDFYFRHFLLWFFLVTQILNRKHWVWGSSLKYLLGFLGVPNTDQAQHHAGEVGSDVQRPSSLWPGRLTQHRQDSCPDAAGRLPATRQRTHARRPAVVRSQLGSRGRSPSTTQPPQQGVGSQSLRQELCVAHAWETKHFYSWSFNSHSR